MMTQKLISVVLADKVERLGDCLQLLSAHALILLRNCFALPKLLYVLRTAPCFRSSTLETYDDCLREILSSVTNTCLEPGSSAWEQAMLPVKLGGLGMLKLLPLLFWPQVIRHLSLSGPSLHQRPLPSLLLILSWTRRSLAGDLQPPEGAAVCKQSAWDGLRATAASERLLSRAGNDEEHARLLSVSGAWLRALPVSALGLRTDDNTAWVCVREQPSVDPTHANAAGRLLTSWVGMLSVIEGVKEDINGTQL